MARRSRGAWIAVAAIAVLASPPGSAAVQDFWHTRNARMDANDVESGPAVLSDGRAEQSAHLWQVSSVIDGDTVDVIGPGGESDRVRLIGMDTPERGVCGFSESSHALSTLVGGQQVTLSPGAVDDRDKYGRLLRYVDVGGVDAGLSLIEGGLAVARYDSRDGYGAHPRETAYVAADAATPHMCDSAQAAPPPAAGFAALPAAEPWSSCSSAEAAGAAPVRQGEPGYARHLDGDGDGVGCE